MDEFEAILLLVFSFLALVITSNFLRKLFIGLILLTTNNRQFGVRLFSLLLLPGIIIHELSHFFVSALLFVPTGKISILPKFEDQDRVKLGSIEIKKTDFLRATIIGIAPMIFGSIIITYIYSFTISVDLAFSWIISIIRNGNIINIISNPHYWILGYLLFAIGNTMLTSREDTHYWPVILLALIPIIVIIILLGEINTALSSMASLVTNLANIITNPYIVVSIVNGALIILLYLVSSILQFLLGKRIRYK